MNSYFFKLRRLSCAGKSRFSLILIILSIFMGTCGLDSVKYLAYVDEGNVSVTSNYRVEIAKLPAGPGHGEVDRIALDFSASRIPQAESSSSSDFSTFRSNFEIYYRIYTSANLVTATISETLLSTVNTTLVSDYNALKPYTVTTNNYAASVGSAFSSRNYWTLDYNSSNDPAIYSLLRSRQLITPYPENRLFFNTTELRDPSYLNINNNADVVSGGTTYTYVSMYIVHTAFDDQTLSSYYSSPTFLGVFLLPDQP